MKPYDVERGRVLQNRDFKQNISEYFVDYSKNTSIQGIRYLGDTHRSIFERLFWIIVLSTSVCLCSSLILQVYRKWQSSPVIVTFSNTLTPVWTVPFPAITICPESKTRKLVYDYSAAINAYETDSNNLTAEELKRLEQINFLCRDGRLKGGSRISDDDIVDFIFDVAPTCDEWYCKWNSTIGGFEDCKAVLTPVLTDDGVCFSFNMLNGTELFTSSAYHSKQFFKNDFKSTNWSFERGYSNDLGNDDYPRRTSAGFTLTFMISIFGSLPDLDYACGGSVQGYKIMLHNPVEIPRPNRNYFMVSCNKQIIVSAKPVMMTTADELLGYDPLKRQCYYTYEKKLQYYKVYTESNCDMECLTNITLKQCGCVAFYMPRNHTTAICGRASALCMLTAERLMFAQEMNQQDINEDELQVRCNCLPSCTSLTYNSEISEVDYKWKELLTAKAIDGDYSNYTFTQVTFFFDVAYFIATERTELYGLFEFIAHCGGFLGLFMGFSFISAIELMYFLTVRLMVNIRNQGFSFWSGTSRVLLISRTATAISQLPLKKYPQYKLTAIDMQD